MSLFTKTGLLLSSTGCTPYNQRQRQADKPTPVFPLNDLIVPAPIGFRPYLHDHPFSNSCSIFCNHPIGDADAKQLLNKTKQVLKQNQALISKNINPCQNFVDYATLDEYNFEEKGGQVFVPEILFRRYTQTDSRPPTPTAIITPLNSNKQLSTYDNTRRCITPEPHHLLNIPEKTRIVLDLRKSLSQSSLTLEGMCINKGNDKVSASNHFMRTVLSNDDQSLHKPLITRIRKNKICPVSSEIAKYKYFSSKRFKEVNNEPRKLVTKDDTLSTRQRNAINFETPVEIKSVKKKAKKTKKKKDERNKLTTTCPSDSAIGIEDLDDTCVTQIGNIDAGSDNMDTEIRNRGAKTQTDGSSRTSSVEEVAYNLDMHDEQLYEMLNTTDAEVFLNHLDAEKYCYLLKCALTPRISLQMNIDQLETKYDLPFTERPIQRSYSINMNPEELQTEFKLSRIFSRRNARFELPLDKMKLIDMKPLEYLKSYVYVSDACRITYNRIFKLFTKSSEMKEYVDAEDVFMKTAKKLFSALAHALGREFSQDEEIILIGLLGFGYDDQVEIDLHTWYGICALCERILGERFSFKHSTKTEDPCYELENADFEFLEKKLIGIGVDEKLKKILYLIRDS